MTRFSAISPPHLSNEHLRQIAHVLRRRVLLQQILIVVMTLFGLPLLVVGPAAAAGMAWAIDARWFSGGLTYHTLFWVCVWVVTPLLFLLESRTQGKFVEEAAAKCDDVDPRISIAAGTNGGELVVLVIFSLLGPGLILGAYRRLRGQLRHRDAPLERCAEVAGQLLRAGVGVDVVSLQQPGEKLEDLRAAIEYLVHYDWAGVGRGGRRVWILTDARKPFEHPAS